MGCFAWVSRLSVNIVSFAIVFTLTLVVTFILLNISSVCNVTKTRNVNRGTGKNWSVVSLI